MKTLLVNKSECTGCMACFNICPEKCIKFERDNEGFQYPMVDEEKCIECGLCQTTCDFPVNKMNNNDKRKAYAVQNRIISTLKKSSSGGVFTELAINTLMKDGSVYGAAWDNGFKGVHHIRIDSENDLYRLQESKYVQSCIGDIYSKVQKDLNDDRFVLFTGTPCQVSALYKYLKKDDEKLITCAVICHGATSPEVWRKYALYLEGRKDSSLTGVHFRDKHNEGWKNFNIKYVFSNFAEINRQDEDLFFRGFMENLYLRPSCYNCEGEWKSNVADIVIGDFWGIDNLDNDINPYYGVSAVITNSERGIAFFDEIYDSFQCERHTYEEIYKYNKALVNKAKQNENREKFFEDLEKLHDVEYAISSNLRRVPTVESRGQELYPIVYYYSNRLLEGKRINALFETKDSQTVVIYANTELMKLCTKDLCSSNKNISIVLSDRDINRLKRDYEEFVCVSPEDVVHLYKNGEIDQIIVCSLFHENEIINDFINKGISNSKIRSIVELIYEL